MKPFQIYDSRNFSGCADSFAGQGICSICGKKGAEYSRARKAYCVSCVKQTLNKTQLKFFERGVVYNSRQKISEIKALEKLVSLGLMEKEGDYYCAKISNR